MTFQGKPVSLGSACDPLLQKPIGYQSPIDRHKAGEVGLDHVREHLEDMKAECRTCEARYSALVEIENGTASTDLKRAWSGYSDITGVRQMYERDIQRLNHRIDEATAYIRTQN